jgi:hypothetical protein
MRHEGWEGTQGGAEAGKAIVLQRADQHQRKIAIILYPLATAAWLRDSLGQCVRASCLPITSYSPASANMEQWFPILSLRTHYLTRTVPLLTGYSPAQQTDSFPPTVRHKCYDCRALR